MRKTLLALLLASSLATHAHPESGLPPIHAALAARDCAPWDGPAFSIWVARPGAEKVNPNKPWIKISVWKDPSLPSPIVLHFPDNTGTVGAVMYDGTAFPSVTGTVTFSRVVFGEDIEGSFEFVTPKGKRIAGGFRAPWRNSPPGRCG